MKYKYLLLLLLMLPFVSGCNDSDDVNGIFTGKVWKLTYITKKNEHKPYDFWGDKDKYEQSIKNYINKEGAYTIKFEGETTDNVISGKFSGTLLSHSYTGTWSANGESNAFSASVKGSENDPLGFSNKFVEGLNRATSYKGNYSLSITRMREEESYAWYFMLIRTTINNIAAYGHSKQQTIRFGQALYPHGFHLVGKLLLPTP